MHLVIPGLVDMPRTDRGEVAEYQVAPGAVLAVYPLVALPAELDTWARDVVGLDATERVRMLALNDTDTDLGWPVTVAMSEVAQTGELRVHFLFRFLEWGGIACLTASSPPAFEAAFDMIKPLIAGSRPDFSGQVVALAQVWADL